MGHIYYNKSIPIIESARTLVDDDANILESDSSLSDSSGWKARRIRQIMEWLRPYIITIQRHWRGYRVRKNNVNSRLKAIRDKLKRLGIERIHNIQCQALSRTYLVQSRVEKLQQAAFTLQSYAIPLILQNHLEAIRWATLTIQSWWKGDRVRRIIREEKLKLLMICKTIQTNEYTEAECEIANYIKNKVLSAQKQKKTIRWDQGLQLIQVTIHVEPKSIYPEGWASSFVKLQELNPKGHLIGISCGSFHTAVITSIGEVYTFGLNDKGQLGIRHIPGLPSPHTPLKFHLRVVIRQVQCGADHTLVLSDEGKVYSWGSNTRGQCGTRPLSDIIPTPEHVTFGSNIVVDYISSGSFHNAAVSNGIVWVWGRSDHLCLKGIYNDIPKPFRLSDIMNEANIGTVCRAECGLACTFLLSDYGDVFVFGNPKSNCLGIDMAHKQTYLPIKLHLSSIIDLQVGINFVIAIDDSGIVWQWGIILEWDPCIHQATKVSILRPMSIDPTIFYNTKIEECAVGWWEAAVRSQNGHVFGWSIFKYCGENQFIPHVYSFDLIRQHHAQRLHMVSCPALTGVFSQMSTKKKKRTQHLK